MARSAVNRPITTPAQPSAKWYAEEDQLDATRAIAGVRGARERRIDDSHDGSLAMPLLVTSPGPVRSSRFTAGAWTGGLRSDAGDDAHQTGGEFFGVRAEFGAVQCHPTDHVGAKTSHRRLHGAESATRVECVRTERDGLLTAQSR